MIKSFIRCCKEDPVRLPHAGLHTNMLADGHGKSQLCMVNSDKSERLSDPRRVSRRRDTKREYAILSSGMPRLQGISDIRVFVGCSSSPGTNSLSRSLQASLLCRQFARR